MDCYDYPLAGCCNIKRNHVYKTWWLPTQNGGDCDYEAIMGSGKMSGKATTKPKGVSVIKTLPNSIIVPYFLYFYLGTY